MSDPLHVATDLAGELRMALNDAVLNSSGTVRLRLARAVTLLGEVDGALTQAASAAISEGETDD